MNLWDVPTTSFIRATHSNENHIQRNFFIQWWRFQNTTPFYIEWKRVGRKLNGGETERVRGRETECCCRWVTVWAINLAIGQIFITARERRLLDLIKMKIKIIYKNLDGHYFSGCCAFSSIHQTTDIQYTSKPPHPQIFCLGGNVYVSNTVEPELKL